MAPWDHPLPPTLYKYVGPERLDVLRTYRIRFSQRSVFPDDHELQPDYEKFGTESEIWRLILQTPFRADARLPLHLVVALIANSPGAQETAKQTALANVRNLDRVGILSLSETHDVAQMWEEYCDRRRGFVIAFNTRHPGFSRLSTPGHLGKLTYSDEAYGTFLGAFFQDGVGPLYRKRMKYGFEREWRTIRFLQRLESRVGGIFLCELDPASISRLIVCDQSIVKGDLEELIARDQRYRHVAMLNLG
jgi:hypothetical protein